jgi:hypothetical protein
LARKATIEVRYFEFSIIIVLILLGALIFTVEEDVELGVVQPEP